MSMPLESIENIFSYGNFVHHSRVDINNSFSDNKVMASGGFALKKLLLVAHKVAKKLPMYPRD